MRKEPFGVGDYVHVFNRGNRKMEIVRDYSDRWRFLQALRFFNDSNSSQNILRKLSLSKSDSDRSDRPDSVFKMGWPSDWPDKDPLIKIMCYCLVPNHFHLLLKEIREKGISRFMQKLGTGHTNYFNIKYQEAGSLFQGGYKARVIRNKNYLMYLSAYIQVINVLELFPGGIPSAIKNLDKALKFVQDYPFSSYPDYIGLRKSLFIDKDTLGEIFPKPEDYKKFVREAILFTKKIDRLPKELKIDS